MIRVFIGRDHLLDLGVVKIGTLLFMCIGLLSGCGNQEALETNRKKLMDGLEDHKIKQVTEEQIHATAYTEGQRIVNQLNQQTTAYWSSDNGREQLDSINKALDHIGIEFLMESSPNSLISGDERALLEAYVYSHEQGQNLHDNVQGTEGDVLLYTYPVISEGSFAGMWSVQLSRKTLVRNF